MWIIPSLITLVRLPMALLFLYPSQEIRTFALLVGALSDFLDGFLARRYNLRSRLGTWLDPILDKFFVIFIVFIFWQEGALTLPQIAILLSRDWAVAIFGVYLVLKRRFQTYSVEAFLCGKIATTLQIAVIMGLIYQIPIPNFVFEIFIVIGCLSLIELYANSVKPQESGP